jgi:hypothetical protein
LGEIADCCSVRRQRQGSTQSEPSPKIARLHRLFAITKSQIAGELSSLLRHPGLAQTGEVSGLEQLINFRPDASTVVDQL